jgi:ABC-type Fe3+ transport system permease subunit
MARLDLYSLIEKGSCRHARYHLSTQRRQLLTRFQLNRRQAFMAFLVCSGTLFFGFILPAGQSLSGTLVALIFACLARFLAVSLQTVETGLGKIRTTIDEVARSLVVGSGEMVRRVHIPMLHTPR